MLWSRQVTMNSVERFADVSLCPTLNYYLKTPDMLVIAKTTPTLRHASMFLMVLFAHLVLIVAATLVKACMYAAPMSDCVVMISMLAGLDGRTAALRGAASSAELEEPLYMDFEVRHDAKREGGRKGGSGNVQVSFSEKRTRPGD